MNRRRLFKVLGAVALAPLAFLRRTEAKADSIHVRFNSSESVLGNRVLRPDGDPFVSLEDPSDTVALQPRVVEVCDPGGSDSDWCRCTGWCFTRSPKTLFATPSATQGTST